MQYNYFHIIKGESKGGDLWVGSASFTATIESGQVLLASYNQLLIGIQTSLSSGFES
jgi:hypothetical protein